MFMWAPLLLAGIRAAIGARPHLDERPIARPGVLRERAIDAGTRLEPPSAASLAALDLSRNGVSAPSSPRLRSGLDEAAPDRVARQLNPVAHSELLEDVGTVSFDRLDADREHLRDRLRRMRLRDQLEHLLLARSERIEAVLFTVTLDVIAHERRHGGGVEERLPAHRRPARLDDVPVGAGLEDVARCSGLERLEEELFVVVHRENEHAQLGLAASTPANGLQAGQARQADVEDPELDVLAERTLDRLRSVRRFGDDLEIGLALHHEL